MTTAVDGQDLFLRLEREVRSPKDALLVDAFLPPPEAIPSALRRPETPRPVPEPSADPSSEPDLTAAMTGARRRADEGPDEPQPQKRRRAVRRAAEPEKSLEEEIAEFMSRSSRALAPDSDPEGK